MSKDESKPTEVAQEEVKESSTLKVYNFTRDGVVVKAKNRQEAEKLLKEQKKSKEDK